MKKSKLSTVHNWCALAEQANFKPAVLVKLLGLASSLGAYGPEGGLGTLKPVGNRRSTRQRFVRRVEYPGGLPALAGGPPASGQSDLANPDA